jgi:CDP-glucose 4,6-dehydratase
MRDLLASRTIEIRNPYSTRPWQHVLEPLGGYLLLGSKMWENPTHYYGAWNFGPDYSSIREVGELTQELINAWGSGAYLTPPQGNRPHEAKLLALDISKAKLNLGWSPTWGFRKTVQETVLWYKAYQAEQKMPEFCELQINAFIKDAKNKL